MLVFGLCLLLATVETKAQQFPKFTTAQFTNTTHRTNVCDRHLQYVAGSLELRDALRGLNITVGVVDQLNDIFIRFDETGALKDENAGLFPVILDELAERAGFQWRNSYARVLPPYSDELANQNVTWTDIMLDAVYRYDFTFAEWAHSLERRKLGISFPAGWFDASIILVQSTHQQSDSTFEFSSFLKPFANSVWIMIFAVFIFTGIVYSALEALYPYKKHESKEGQKMGYNIFMSAMTFSQHHMEWYPKSHSQRLFAFSVSFWALIMASAYTANLASFLVADNRPQYVALSLSEAEANGIKVCVREGAAVARSVAGRYPTLKLVEAPDFAEVYAKLRAGECKLLATRAFDFAEFQRNGAFNPDCTLEWVGRADELNSGGAGTMVDTGVYCTSLVTHVLDIYFTEMIADGFIEASWEKHLRSRSSDNCGALGTREDQEEESDDASEQSLEPVDVGGIFILHGILGVVSLISAFFERKRWLRKRKKGYSDETTNDLPKKLGNDNRQSSLASTANESALSNSIGKTRHDSDFFHDWEEDALVLEAIATLNRHLAKRKSRRKIQMSINDETNGEGTGGSSDDDDVEYAHY